jgi:hypothetical protein
MSGVETLAVALVVLAVTAGSYAITCGRTVETLAVALVVLAVTFT